MKNKKIDPEAYSPSNNMTGWHQKYFYKVEDDGMLNSLISIFRKNGNTWQLDQAVYDVAVQKRDLKRYHTYDRVSREVLEVVDGKVQFREYPQQELLRLYRKFSWRNFWKQLFKRK